MIADTLRTNLAIQAITFATSVIVARLLGPTGRGELALVLLYPQLVTTMALLGIDRAVAVMAGRGELAQPVRTIIKLVLMLLLPTMATAWIAISWRIDDSHLAYLAKLYMLYAPTTHFFVMMVAMYNGLGDFSRFNRARLGFYVLNILLVGVIWVSAPLSLPTLELVLLANFVSAFGGWLYSIWLLRKFKSNEPHETEFSARRGIDGVMSQAMVFAFPLALAQFNGVAYQIIVEYSTDVTALGMFVVLYTYSRLLSPIGGAVCSHIFRFGIADDQRDIARLFRFSLVVYFCCIVPLWLLAPLLIPLIFGSTFVYNIKVIGALLMSALFSMLADSLAEYLNGQRLGFPDTVGRLLYITTLGLTALFFGADLTLFSIAIAMATGDLARCVWLVQRVASATGCRASCFINFQPNDAKYFLYAFKKNFLSLILFTRLNSREQKGVKKKRF